MGSKTQVICVEHGMPCNYIIPSAFAHILNRQSPTLLDSKDTDADTKQIDAQTVFFFDSITQYC